MFFISNISLVFIIASLILKENQAGGREIAVLMSLLLFDEIATIEKWCVYISSTLFFLIYRHFVLFSNNSCFIT